MNLVQGAVSAWLQLIIWKQTDAPKYHKGFITLAVLSVIYMATTVVLRQLQKRQDAQKEK
jgi:ACS family pantothenate transporter-like MFS transporter